jgi:hypothetical protein
MTLIDRLDLLTELLVESCIRRAGFLACAGWAIALFAVGFIIGRSMA